MSEVVHIKVGDKAVALPDLSSIKAGNVYRICCGTFMGPWRKAACDATKNSRGQWHVKPTTANKKKTNGYDG